MLSESSSPCAAKKPFCCPTQSGQLDAPGNAITRKLKVRTSRSDKPPAAISSLLRNEFAIDCLTSQEVKLPKKRTVGRHLLPKAWETATALKAHRSADALQAFFEERTFGD